MIRFMAEKTYSWSEKIPAKSLAHTLYPRCMTGRLFVTIETCRMMLVPDFICGEAYAKSLFLFILRRCDV